MEKLEINSQFKQTLNFINQTNQNVFLTGKAGTGKTTLLKYIKQNTYKQIVIVAPTGVAAINAGGSTIHSFFQFAFNSFVPIFKDNGEYNFSAMHNNVIKFSSQRLNIIRQLELLVIDEVSMLRADLLDQIDYTLRIVRKRWDENFGGVQVLLIGDMYQLPPVVQQEEWKIMEQNYLSPYFFDSYVIQKAPPVFIELDKIYRQTEQRFIELLNKVRNNQLDEKNLELLNSCYQASISQAQYQSTITLTTHNRIADGINLKNLAEIKSKSFKYQANVKGTFSEKNFPVDEELVLKVGTKVMFLKNNSEKNYFNGKIGTVTFLSEETIKVKCEEDLSEIEVASEIWDNVSYSLDNATKKINEEVLGSFSQFPLRYAWAITIHKSQGLTFDKLIIDAAKSFSAGQVYVALSRCRSLDGLTLSSKIPINALKNDNSILQFSTKRYSDDKLEASLFEGKKKYLSTLLFQIFNLENAKEIGLDIQKFVFQFSNKFDSQNQIWFKDFLNQNDLLFEVSKKFLPQLQQLIYAAQSPETDENLINRVIQAGNYFEEKTNLLFQALLKCPAITESKEASREINELLKQLHDELFLKNYFFKFCKTGFNFNEFVKQKLQIKYPECKINIYSSAKNAKVNANVDHPKLFKKLLLLRDEIVNENNRPIYLVASGTSIAELSNYLPTTKEELLQISGFGKSKVDEFGEEFLKIISDYLEENNLKSNMENFPKKKKKEKVAAEKKAKSNTEKVDTKEISFRMFNEGFSISEIALHRKYTTATISNHLVPYVRSEKIPINKLVDEEKQKIIFPALKKFKQEEGLTKIKNALPESISFDEIKFCLASLGPLVLSQ